MIEKRFIHTFGDEWPRAIGPALTVAPNGDWLCHWVAGPSTALAHPHAIEVDGRLHVVYDLGRRDIVQLVVDLDAL